MMISYSLEIIWITFRIISTIVRADDIFHSEFLIWKSKEQLQCLLVSQPPFSHRRVLRYRFAWWIVTSPISCETAKCVARRTWHVLVRVRGGIMLLLIAMCVERWPIWIVACVPAPCTLFACSVNRRYAQESVQWNRQSNEFFIDLIGWVGTWEVRPASRIAFDESFAR